MAKAPEHDEAPLGTEGDFERYCRWYPQNLRIIDKRSRIVPFQLNNVQRVLERYKWECKLANKPCYMLILKARKEGVSTWAEGSLFRDNRDISNRMALVIAHDDDATSVIFGMTKFYYEYFPEKIPLKKSNARELHFEDTNALFRVRTAGGAGSVGRAATYQAVHLSEIDKWPFPEELYQAIMPTLPDSGYIVVIAESTADGPMLMMNQLWDQADEGRSEYKTFFFPWWVDHDYVREITYEDIRRYAPRDWLAQNKKKIEGAEYREQKKAVRFGLEPSDLRGRSAYADRGSLLAGSLVEGHPATDGGGGQEVGGAPRPAGGEGNGEAGAFGENEGAGDRSRRPVPGLDLAPGASRASRKPGDGYDLIPRRLRPSGTPYRREYSEDCGSFDEGWDIAHLDIAGDPYVDRLAVLDAELPELFRESMTGYEIGLCEEFDLCLEQINWLRYCLETKCKSDETRRRREYPSRPEEAFEASGKDILDPMVLARWAKEAKDTRPLWQGSFFLEDLPAGGRPKVELRDDPGGKTMIWEPPDPKARYVAFLDPASGVQDSDWQVCFVMNVETGDQAAEFRATIDPDQAVDQVEGLCLHFNVTKLAIETNGGYATPFVRHMADRRTVKLYEREVYHKFTRQLTKVPGWNTDSRTRTMLVAETKEAVRKDRCRIKSEKTVRECRTLYENATGKIEARPPNTDDGWIAYGGCLLLRNAEIAGEKQRAAEDRKSNSFLKRLVQLDRKRNKAPSLKNLVARTKMPRKTVGAGVTERPDCRRSWG